MIFDQLFYWLKPIVKMENQQEQITIGPCTLFGNLFQLAYVGSIYSYYTYSYAEVSDVAKNTDFFKLFLTLIISCWLLIIPILCRIKLIFEFFGQTMPQNIW